MMSVPMPTWTVTGTSRRAAAARTLTAACGGVAECRYPVTDWPSPSPRATRIADRRDDRLEIRPREHRRHRSDQRPDAAPRPVPRREVRAARLALARGEGIRAHAGQIEIFVAEFHEESINEDDGWRMR